MDATRSGTGMTARAPAHITAESSDGTGLGLINTKPILNIDPTFDMNRPCGVDGN